MKEFWKPQPKQPWHDWRTYSLIVPLILSSIAFGIFSVFTYALGDINVIDTLFQSRLVVMAAFCAAIGAEVGTPFTIIEVFRKVRIGRAERQDWFALGASLVATLIVVTIGMASRITHSMETPPIWASKLVMWGPVVVGAAVVLDGYGGMIEAGDLFGTFEQRMESWLLELEAHESKEPDSKITDSLTLLADHVTKLTEKIESLHARIEGTERRLEEISRPVARIADFRDIIKNSNGESGKLDKELLADKVSERGLSLPNESTVSRWLNSLG